MQKYLCRSCGRGSNPLTGTVLNSRKMPISEWIEYLLHLLEFHSVVTYARDNRRTHTTGVYWLRKVFAALEGCQDFVVLSGTFRKHIAKGFRHAHDGDNSHSLLIAELDKCNSFFTNFGLCFTCLLISYLSPKIPQCHFPYAFLTPKGIAFDRISLHCIADFVFNSLDSSAPGRPKASFA